MLINVNTLISRLVLFTFPALFICAVHAGNVDYVNAYIGTADVPNDSGTEYGGTMPFVEPPFAMTSWTPQTRENKISRTSYNYADTNIFGFIGTHQAAIWMGDYGYVTVMPETGDIKTSETERQLPFSHSDEHVSPYYYSVSLGAGAGRRIKAEITATEHCAIMRFTYPSATNGSLVVQATRAGIVGNIMINPAAREIAGYNPDRMDAKYTSLQLPNFKGYFVIQINRPFTGFGTYHGQSVDSGLTNILARNVGAYVTFGPTKNDVVEVKIGTSFISIDQARANLTAEISGWDFDSVKAHLKDIWNQKLGEISIRGCTQNQRIQFYTGMYHCLLYPRLFSEHGRYYSAFDDRIHSGVAYTDYSGWDIFRAEFTFLTLICPERINDMVQALLNDYQEGGWMPKWPNPSYTDIMLSTPADSMVAEAMAEGFHGFDYHLAWRAVYKDAMTPPNEDTSQKWPDRSQGKPYSAREGLTYYMQYGYVPENWTARAASCTLEHAYYDWCAAQVAKAVGRTNDYQFFNNRSFNYKNIFNPATGLMNSRYADGTWASPKTGWSEGGQDGYTFAVLHDVPGLVQLMGGTSNFNQTLSARTKDLNALVNNEPGNHYLYLYDFSGQPAQCQNLVRDALTNFDNSPAGLPGNDDCGQTTGWLLFQNMGFYPVNPASGVYMIGSPLFGELKLNLPNGRVFAIKTIHNSSKNKYIQSAALNGSLLDVPYITYQQIMAGGSLRFVMGPAPSAWASNWRGTPLSPLP